MLKIQIILTWIKKILFFRSVQMHFNRVVPDELSIIDTYLLPIKTKKK